MNSSDLLGMMSPAVALIAVAVAVWQIRVHLAVVGRSNSLPVAAAAFNEFRSRQFRDHVLKVWNDAPTDVPAGGFQALPEPWRESAYQVAYFFENLGILVVYDLVPEELIVDFVANAVVRSWRALEPFIKSERIYREEMAIAGLSPKFVSHFEHLAAITTKTDSYGRSVDDAIHKRLRLQKVSS